MKTFLTNYLLIIEGAQHSFAVDSLHTITIDDRDWHIVDDLDLGGYFYDYILGTSSHLIGVRYWSADENPLTENFVLAQFLGDRRFFFDETGSFVDIIFELDEIHVYKNGSFLVDNVQDFGGDRVVKSGDLYGILFGQD